MNQSKDSCVISLNQDNVLKESLMESYFFFFEIRTTNIQNNQVQFTNDSFEWLFLMNGSKKYQLDRNLTCYQFESV